MPREKKKESRLKTHSTGFSSSGQATALSAAVLSKPQAPWPAAE